MKTITPVLYKVSFAFTFSYIITAILSLTGFFNICYFLVLANAALISVFICKNDFTNSKELMLTMHEKMYTLWLANQGVSGQRYWNG